MADICLINILGVNTLCFANYVVYGFILFVLGLLASIYLPAKFSKKLGLSLIIVGLVMMIGFPLLVSWWSNVYFQVLVFSGVLFGLIYLLLFSDKKNG